MIWGTASPSAKLTGDSGSAFEALLIGDCRLFRSWWKIRRCAFLGLLQKYRPEADIGRRHRSDDAGSSRAQAREVEIINLLRLSQPRDQA
jgi:hypothetical protein